jgi:RNA polymerase sigma-70 factor, ECF subfamily
MPSYESEDYLVQQAIKRDKAAFGSLYDLHVDRIYRRVYYRVSNEVDAEDITQEVFVRAWKAIDRYRKTGAPFVTWLLTIANHLIVDHYRNRKNTVTIDEIDDKNPGNQDMGPEEQSEVNFDNTLIRQAVFKLKGNKQKVILMHFIDGFSYEEIARTLNKSEGAVRVIQYRALNDLRKLLKRD